jgi:hypothetical protein
MVTMLNPKTLPNAFGLAQLQEQEINRRNRNPKNQNWPSNISYSRLPTPTYAASPSTISHIAIHPQTLFLTETLLPPIPIIPPKNPLYLSGEFLLVKYRREGPKGCVTTATRSTNLGISVLSPGCMCWKEWNWRKKKNPWRKG